MFVALSLIAFLLCLAALVWMHVKDVSFNIRVIAGLVAGIVFGAVLHAAGSAENIAASMRWISLVGTAYVRLLKMVVIPLIFVSIVCAVTNRRESRNLGKATALILVVLLATAAISAVVGGVTAQAFGLSAEGIEIGEAESARMEYIAQRAESAENFETTIVNMIPDNPFYALTGQGTNATLGVVIFAVLLGLGVLGLRKYEPDNADRFDRAMQAFNSVVVEVVMIILAVTPFGIFSLMAKTVSGSDYASIMRLVMFVAASYAAIAVMFVVHGLLLGLVGLNPITFYRKAGAALLFAFTSRTSVGTLPLTTSSLTEKMGVDKGVAALAASLGTSIGQNGCAAIYPAMLVVMVAPTVGQKITPGFFILMVIVITFASIGIAGVGGGATFAGITVLSALGLPVGIAGLLVAVEPLIDMARTALNVSDGMLAALMAAKWTKNIDTQVYNDKSKIFKPLDYRKAHLEASESGKTD